MEEPTVNFEKWYSEHYPRLNGYGAWLRGRELGTLAPEQFNSRNFRVLFSRLSTYQDTVHSFTHWLLYNIAASIPDVYPDIAYLPSANDVAIFEKGNVPWLIGTQSKKSYRVFDLVAFSNSIVQELINLPHFFKNSGIPLSRKDRLNDPEIPLIILGGSNAAYSYVAWGEDAWVDGVYIGDNHQDIRRLILMIANGKKANVDKTVLLTTLAREIPGFVLPNAVRDLPVTSPSIQKLDDCEYEKNLCVPFDAPAGRITVQISDGCSSSCNFCAECWNKKPYRERSLKQILEIAKTAKIETGADSVDLYAFNFNMHKEFTSIVSRLLPLFRNIGLKSQRLDMLLQNPGLLEIQKLIGKSTFTFGVEGISDRIRGYLNKGINEKQICDFFSLIFKQKPREIKVFLIASGLENEGDFNELTSSIAWIRKQALSSRGTRVIFSVTPLVRFPRTPLEFEEALSVSLCKRTIDRISAVIKGAGFEVRTAASVSEYLVSQVILRASEQTIKTAFYNTVNRSRTIYYDSIPQKFADILKEELVKQSTSVETIFSSISYEQSQQKIWSYLPSTIRREILQNRHKQLWKMDAKTETHKLSDNSNQLKSALKFRDNKPQQLLFLVEIFNQSRGLPRSYVARALARSIMKAYPDLVEYEGYEASFWDNDGTRKPWITGKDLIVLKWSSNNRDQLISLSTGLLNSEFVSRINHNFLPFGRLLSLSDAWKPSGITINSPYVFKPEEYFRSCGLKHTLIKTAEREYKYQFTASSLKKGLLNELTAKTKDGTSSIRLRVGPKFDLTFLEELIQKSFLLSHPRDWPKTIVIAE